MMSLYYDLEKDRAPRTLKGLNEIFDCYSGTRFFDAIRSGDVHGGHTSDGHTFGQAEAIDIIVEVKNELSSTNLDASIQLAAYYTKSINAHASADMRKHFLFPALGILVAGAHIGFYALTFTTKTRLVALMPHLSMAMESGNRYGRQNLLNAFEAACILRSHIINDMERMKNTPLNEIDADPRWRSLLGDFPYVHQVPVGIAASTDKMPARTNNFIRI
ncbi:hypothetical protein B0F90DRAFT_726443 [Multifurca ochricompacta]|uniref:Uncharacterized protein n=1 Tax=Multifurca ochricompacta TaxID=376703 RepID=A0AAD4MBV4_9AGAM|nr:hypothetical protein B0F90DRAFT_726443 [Multifurca ochricompacta]